MAIYNIPRIVYEGDIELASHMAREGIRQLGILKTMMSFNDLQQDIRKVEYIDGNRIVCSSCFGEDVVHIYAVKEEEGKLLPKLYVYVTISNYVTIWDLLTGEVATDICNNDGKVYDYYGEPLITFPCHKDDLVKWLEGIPNKPTRQVLKDEPENNRDYLNDNKIDIGNENRVELANEFDPSYNLYYGVPDTPHFTKTVRDELVDEKNPYCCYEADCVVNPLDYFIYGTVLEKNTPNPLTLIDCTPEECSDSFSCKRNLTKGKDCKMHNYYGPSRRCRGCNYATLLNIEVEYIQKYLRRTKHLYLSPYPSLTYLRLEGPGRPSISVEYSIKDASAYREAIDIEQDNTKFSSSTWLTTSDWQIKKEVKNGDVVSINTKLSSLMIDYIPYREWINGTKRVHDRMNDVTEDAFLSTYLREGVCNSVSEWEATARLWDDTIHPPTNPPQPDHATEDLLWCKGEARSVVDIRSSESNRTGITWCGSPTPIDEINKDGEVIKEAITKNWYRVILAFYMGGFHTGGHEAMQNWKGNPFYCPNEEMCEELVEQYGGAGAECTATSWSNELVERFSSVQATIESESPKDYPKDRTERYKRPDDYEEHPEKYSSFSAFPGRTQGYPEDEENNICYPFDGTYDIYTLGKAIEELINNHYEDGSDDQLLVYLYKRPNMISQSTG